MTQPPYQPPAGFDYYTPPPPDPLAPARRASTMMYIVGGLALLLGTCVGGIVAALPELMKNPDFAQALQQTPEFSQERMKLQGTVQATILGLLGICLIVLAVFVRKGGKGSVVASLVLVSLVLLYLLLELALLVGRGRELPPPALCGASCFLVVPLLLFAVLLAFLVQGVRSAGKVKAMREQYAQQYWQYAYQQQMYRQNPTHTPPPLQPPPPPGSSGGPDDRIV